MERSGTSLSAVVSLHFVVVFVALFIVILMACPRYRRAHQWLISKDCLRQSVERDGEGLEPAEHAVVAEETGATDGEDEKSDAEKRSPAMVDQCMPGLRI